MKKGGAIHVGTSGWNYDHWIGPFYPDDLPHGKWLEFYAEHLPTVEINNTFYQLPRRGTFESWRDGSPDGFVFSVKASRYITHMKKLKDPGEALSRFLSRAAVLEDKLGVILFQLPPRWNCNTDRLASFLASLPADLRCAFEFRDPSWWNRETYDLLARHNAAFCIFDLAGRMSPKEITCDTVYIRLHGPGDAYQGLYDASALSGWAGACAAWKREGRNVYCYFDNDQKGYAVRNARWLRRMLSEV